MHCPKCGYDLAGLPTAHTCPECGLAYDPLCRVVRLPCSTRARLQVIYGCALIALALWAILRFGGKAGDASFLGLLVVLTAVAMVRATRTGGIQRLLVLNEAGVQFQDGPRASALVPWAELHAARVRAVHRDFRLESVDGSVLLACRIDQLGGWRAARLCAREIRDLQEAYRRTFGSRG
jgi:hypothetical protein